VDRDLTLRCSCGISDILSDGWRLALALSFQRIDVYYTEFSVLLVVLDYPRAHVVGSIYGR
jgi:hypothetical protein